MKTRFPAALVLCLAGILHAQPVLTETVEYPQVGPGPLAVQSGTGCFFLASGTITPGDVDWVRINIPRATTQTVVDIDFPTNGAGSALLASVVGGSTAFNIADNNNSRDALCGLSASTFPVGSTRDSAVNLSATARNAVIDIGITGAEDTGFTGAHGQSFAYDVWVYAVTVPCTSDGDCGDGVLCTRDSCDLGTGSCTNASDDAMCDNGLFCDGEEFCDGARGCGAGPRPDCDDGVDCTVDACDEALDQCVSTADDSFCDDGVFCNGAESCDVRFDCQDGAPPVCEDGVGCTVDWCDADLDACVHDADDVLCDDGLFCNGEETCDAARDCQAGSPPDCSDGVDCTVDFCDAALDACVSESDHARCDNGVFCDGEEFCDALLGCQASEPPCAGGLCRESDDQCVECLADADCDDGAFCNGPERCDASGVCLEGVSPCPAGLTCDEASRRCESGLFTLDAKPAACPNRFNGMGNGYYMFAITGAPGADVRLIDPASLRLTRTDAAGGSLSPNLGSSGPRPGVQDLATPFEGAACACSGAGSDGQDDLVFHFSVPAMKSTLQLGGAAETVQVRVTGRLRDGTPIDVTDCLAVDGPRGRSGQQ